MADDEMVERGPLHYVRGSWFGANVLNRAVLLLARVGVSLWDSRILRVRGRKTGRVYATPVNLLALDGRRYLVAPRGHTQWVRNVRSGGGGELQLGRRVERVRAIEVVDNDVKVTVLRAYLRRWKFEVGMFFAGVGPDSPDAELARIAPDHPVFEIHEDRASGGP